MKICKFIAALLFVSVSATAASLPVSSGKLTPTTEKLIILSDDEDGFSAHFGHDFVSDYAKLFTNDYAFNVGTNGVAAGSLTSTFVLNKKDVYISGFNIFTGSGALVSSGVNHNVKSNQTSMVDTWIMPDVSLTSGAYYLEVTGQVLGNKGGSYGGDFVMAPVPEPGVVAMMGLGLGLIGFMIKRRSI